MFTLVFIRHGESLWNRQNRFTGWTDVDLSEIGEKEAKESGKLLLEEGYDFDLAFSSLLKRSIRTLNIVLDTMDLHWIPVIKNWRLNERHYGALQGLYKNETAEKYGEDQVLIWRRSYSTRPPLLDVEDERFPIKDPRYCYMAPDIVPRGECLKDTVARVLPFWYDSIVPALKSGRKILIVAHGNSLRAIVKHLDKMSDDDIVGLNIPTGIPLVYELDEELNPLKSFYLGNKEEIEKRMKAVKSQGKKS